MADVARSEMAARQSRWLAMWREAVRTSPIVSALVELSTSRLIELSDEAATLLGTTPRDGAGKNYLSFAQRPREAAQTFQLARDGVVDGIRARRQFQRPDGSSVEVESWAWAVRSASGPDLGLWVALPASSGAESNPADEDVPTSSAAHAHTELDGLRLRIDDHWRIAEISDPGTAALGTPTSELHGLSILELTRSGDVLNLLLGFARATTEADTCFVVRWRHRDGCWRKIHLAPTVLDGDGTVPFQVNVRAEPEPTGADAAAAGAIELAGYLRRIADTIEAAGNIAPLGQKDSGTGLSPAAGLSPRQWEVVARLLRGERVAMIAREMYLSQSTVRNHLAAVYGKFDVHSQAELVAKLLHQEVQGTN